MLEPLGSDDQSTTKTAAPRATRTATTISVRDMALPPVSRNASTAFLPGLPERLNGVPPRSPGTPQRRSSVIPLPNRRNQVLVECAPEIIRRSKAPVAPRGAVVHVRRPRVDDRLSLRVRAP